MSRDEDNGEEQLDLGSEKDWQAEDDLFNDFDSDGEFDDSDRDSDFAPVYDEDEVEEEAPPYFDDPVDEEESPRATYDSSPPWDYTGEDDEEPVEELSWEPEDVQPWDADEGSDPDAGYTASEPPPVQLPPIAPLPETEPAPDWAEHDDEADYYTEEEEPGATLPLGLILVGVVALILLGAGGYGVMQQRAAMQEEVRQLRSQLATAASPGDVAQTRATSESLKTLNAELESRLESLERENRTLQATVNGLEKQLQAQQAAMNKQADKPPSPAPAAQAKPAPKPAPKPVIRSATTAPTPAPAPKPTARSTSTVSAGSWFVNFGSYGQQATAQGWADRLQPGAGEVVVTTGEKDGRTFYRVRVVNLPSREQADATARILEQRYGLSRLWVGQSG